ncbi:MAG: hypothetical protein HDR33_05235 [Treponema sp.]|nr:hypothetical protein [Treponema sp.]
MKKHAIQFLVIFLIFVSDLNAFSARWKPVQNVEWKSIQDVYLSESITDESNICLASVKKFDLKNNCSLIIRPMVETENENQIIFTQVYLETNGNLQLILDHEDGVSFFRSAPKYIFRYDDIDFDNYFCLTQYDGDYYHYLFDKRNGEMVLDKFIGTADLSHNILFYLDENDEMILYDLNSNEKYNIDKYLLYGKHGSMRYWENFKVVYITKENYVILFWGNIDRNGDEIPLLINVPK